MSALNKQIGGAHYRCLKIQPMEYSMLNDLDACQHTIIKYVTRFREKGGVVDLDKAIHCIEMLKEFYLKEIADGEDTALPSRIAADLQDGYGRETAQGDQDLANHRVR